MQMQFPKFTCYDLRAPRQDTGMSDSSSSQCPQCGADMPRSTEGLCPRCLMAQIVQPTQDGGETAALASPLTPEELAPHFPQLEILECLGRGGMGVVYKARQKSLNRLVALKLLAPERADDPQFAARFEKEAQALAALNHPHIVAVHDFGKAGGFYYLLMEFVDGVNLRQLLQTKRLTPKEALSIVPPVCDALQCAHDHGIVHRDIKPENLLIDKAGVVKIADFGVARMLRDGTSVSHEPHGSYVSHPVLGTPAYAAPEQQNGSADHRADIYSLGVVLYEMLTGERPKDKIEAPSKRVQVDVRIDEIVLRALEKTPELRFATAAEFRSSVEAAVRPQNKPLSGAQRLFQRWLPVSWFEKMKAESQQWHLVCDCGHATSVWDRGGIRAGASGRPMKLMSCPACGKITTHRMEWRGEGGPENPKKGSMNALAVNAAVWVALALVALGIGFLVEVIRDGMRGEGMVLFAALLAGAAPIITGILRGTWMRGFAVSAFILALPCVLIALFFIYAMSTESGGWHPAPSEAFIVPLSWIGAIFFPPAGVVLWHGGRPSGQRMGCVGLAVAILAGVFLLLLLIGGVFIFSYRQASQAEQATRNVGGIPRHIEFKVLRVENPPGSLTLRLHFERDSNHGLGFEVAMDAKSAPDGKLPDFQDSFWLRTSWVGPENARVMSWTLPGQFTPDEARVAAAQIEKDLFAQRNAWSRLPDGAVPKVGSVRHRDGWSCELFFRVKRAPDFSPVKPADAWVVEGTVRGSNGEPVPDADIHVSAGMGSLHTTGEGKTGADGKYRVTFGPGFLMAIKDRAGALQMALVHAGKDGYAEKNLCEAGNLQMAWELTKQQLAGGWQPGPARTFLPGKPLTVDFVLVPAAQIQGTLIDKDGKPVANREIVITGDRIGPGGSIYGSTRTDSQGRFTFKDVSTQHAWSFSIDDRSGNPERTPPDRFATPTEHRITLEADRETLRRVTAAPTKADVMNESPITSSIASNDNSPEAIAKAQQLGVAAAAKDIQAENFRILAYGIVKASEGDFDEETGYRLQSVAGTILSSAFQAECDAYNFAMRDHFQKHVRWKRPATENVATKPGSHVLPQDVKLVITESKPGKAEDVHAIDAQLVWGPSYKSKPDQTYEFRVSEGMPYAIAWSADGRTLWVTCSARLGTGKDERITRFLRILTLSSPGVVDEELKDAGELDAATLRSLPQALRDIVSPQPTTTLQGTMSDDDLKQLAWHEFDQTKSKYWRELADVRRFKEAAELIEKMLSLHPELEKVNASNLHFHAGQCWAFAGEKEHALNQLKLARHPSGTNIGLRWNDYVHGTEAFLSGDKRELLNAHESLAEGDPINKPNLCVLDRLIANFGKPYAEAYETDGQDHKKLSADCFNRTWELLEKKERTAEENERMISLSHASLAHWRMREDCTDRNLSIGYWQLSRVYAVLGQGNNAERYGGLCLRVSSQEPPFYLAYAHEALARAALLNERRELFDKHLAEAKTLAAKVTDAEEKKMLVDDLATLLWH
jgi:tRNA A-37 threonylcarbamoyl transferase component Bud32